VLSRDRLAGEFANNFDVTRSEAGNTRTLGAVAHVTSRLSLFFNDSSNFGNTRFGVTILPKVIPPPAQGQGRDFGLMLDPFGVNRIFLRLTRFESTQVGDASLTPGGVTGDHYVSQPVIRVFNYLEGRGLIGRATADAERAKSRFSSFTIDTASRGYEAELVANITKPWTARLAYSYTDRGRENYFAERDPTLANWIALWRSKDDRGPARQRQHRRTGNRQPPRRHRRQHHRQCRQCHRQPPPQSQSHHALRVRHGPPEGRVHRRHGQLDRQAHPAHAGRPTRPLYRLAPDESLWRIHLPHPQQGPLAPAAQREQRLQRRSRRRRPLEQQRHRAPPLLSSSAPRHPAHHDRRILRTRPLPPCTSPAPFPCFSFSASSPPPPPHSTPPPPRGPTSS